MLLSKRQHKPFLRLLHFCALKNRSSPTRKERESSHHLTAKMLSQTLRSSTASLRVANRTVRRRCLATSSSQSSSTPSDNNASTSTSSAQPHSQSPSQDRPLTPVERAFLDKAIRVDQAGELAANYIHAGQTCVLGCDPQVGNVVKVCSSCSFIANPFSYNSR